jgi:hypothetical protein
MENVLPRYPRWLQNKAALTTTLIFSVTLAVLLFALAVVYQKLALHHFDPLSFAQIDGKFVYRLARSFPSLLVPLDLAPYRAQRILLSALASPFGDAIPWALIGINLVALAAGSYALAQLAHIYQLPVILGGIFGLWIGSLFAIQLNLTEVLAYSLVIWGIWFWERRQPLPAALLFGLAILAKESAILYPAGFLMASLRWSWPQRTRFALLALAPGMLWQLVLVYTFGQSGLTAGVGENHMFPLSGLLDAELKAAWAWGVQIAWVLIPSLIAVAWGLILLWKRHDWPVAWVLILNGLFVTSLPPESTDYLVHSTRIELAVIVALTWAIFRTRRQPLALLWFGLVLVPLIFFRPGFYF